MRQQIRARSWVGTSAQERAYATAKLCCNQRSSIRSLPRAERAAAALHAVKYSGVLAPASTLRARTKSY
jgi:hypothetical protein